MRPTARTQRSAAHRIGWAAVMCVLALSSLGSPRAAWAEPQGGLGDEATVRYRNGQAFAAREAWDAALAEFLASEQHRRSWQAAAGAARCLEKLGRYDE